MFTEDDLNKVAYSNVGLGALGGAGLGLLVQALRPKDEDQSAWKEYLMSALLGAGLGAASGYAYDAVSNKSVVPPAVSKITAERGMTTDNYPRGADDRIIKATSGMKPGSGVTSIDDIHDIPEYDKDGNLVEGTSFWITPGYIEAAYKNPKDFPEMIAAAAAGLAGTVINGDIYPLVRRVWDDGQVTLVPALDPIWRRPR